MGIGTLIIGLALLIVVILFVGLPLLDARRPAVPPPSQREALQTERESIVRAIREIDLDYRTGKLAAEDYRALRASQVQRGAQILRDLEALRDGDDVDAEIERQVATLRADAGKSMTDEPVCPACQTPIRAGDQYCAKCGQPLAELPHRLSQERATPDEERQTDTRL